MKILAIMLIAINAHAADIRQVIVSQCLNDSALAARIQQIRQKFGTSHDVFNATIRKTANGEAQYDKQLSVGREVYSLPADVYPGKVYGIYLRQCLKDARDHLSELQ